jgi:hypothetical protein
MASPLLHPQGYWLSHEEGHFFDPILARELELLLYGKSVCDFGCGMGEYVHWFRKNGLECDGYDGNPNTYELSLGECGTLDLAKPFDLEKRYDAVICLEVAEHVPRQYEAILLDNLARHAREMIVLSWAVPGQLGDGHVNNRMNSYAIYRLWQRGFRLQPSATISLRAHSSLPWFAHTLMVFSRIRPSSAELKVATHIFLQDISRLNKSNSSFLGASIGKAFSFIGAYIGKAFRVYCDLESNFALAVNVFRMLRYDAMSFLRPRFEPAERIASHGSFFPVCFTCKRDFEFLRLALRSLSIRAPRAKEIHIYIDKADPLTIAQRELLRLESRFPLVFQNTLYPMSWAGPRTILNELHAFRSLARQMTVKDFLVKFDSDVIFLSDTIFQFVANSAGEAIGTSVLEIHSLTADGHAIDYMQGGCYFIAAAKLRAILNLSVTKTALSMLRERANIFEDQFISDLLQQCGARTVYNSFLYYDSTLAKADLDEAELEARLRAIPATTSVLHFEGNKSNMRRVANILLPSSPTVCSRYQHAS